VNVACGKEGMYSRTHRFLHCLPGSVDIFSSALDNDTTDVGFYRLGYAFNSLKVTFGRYCKARFDIVNA
jgi:hypothetical protein